MSDFCFVMFDEFAELKFGVFVCGGVCKCFYEVDTLFSDFFDECATVHLCCSLVEDVAGNALGATVVSVPSGGEVAT